MALKTYTQEELAKMRGQPTVLQTGTSATSAVRMFNTPVQETAFLKPKVDTTPVASSPVPTAIKTPAAIPTTQSQSSPTIASQPSSVPDKYGDSVAGLQKWYDEDPAAYEKWVEGGGKANQDGVVSLEEMAQAKIDEDRKAQREEELKRLGKYVTPETQEEEDLINNQRNEADMTELERQIASLNKIDRANFKAEADRTASAEAGATASFSQSREGVQSESTALVAPEFKSRSQAQLDIANERLSNAMIQREGQLKQLKDAQDANDKERVQSIRSQLARTQNSIIDAQTEASKAAAEASKEAKDLIKAKNEETAATFNKIKTLGDLSKTAGGSIFQGWTPQDISDQLGIDLGTASMVANIDMRIGAMDTSALDYEQKVANLAKTRQEAMWAGMTTEQKNFSVYRDMLKTNPAEAAKFARQIGVDPSSNEAYSQRMRWNEYALKYYNDTGTWPSEGGIVSSDGSFDTQDQPGEKGGQCGEYVNKVFGSKLFGDSLSQKKTLINSQTPVVGGAFISKNGYNLATIGQTGHVGIVTKVYPDGSFDIKDSNRNGDELVDTSHVTNAQAQGIVGFFDPSKPAGSGKWDPGTYTDAMLANAISTPGYTSVPTPILPDGNGLGAVITKKDTVLSQIKTGKLPSTDWDKWRNIADRDGWLGEFDKAINDPKIQPISSITAEKYGVQEALTQYQLDEVLAYREQQGYGNKAFQKNFYNTKGTATSLPPNEQLVKSIQLRNNLEGAWNAYRKMTEMGMALQDVESKSKRFYDNVKRFFGGDEGEAMRLYDEIDQITGKSLVEMVKAISGVAVSEQEFQRLQKYSPNVSQPDSKFQQQLMDMMRANEEFQRAQAKKYGFNSLKDFEETVMGFREMPSAYPGLDPNFTQQSEPQDINPDPAGLGIQDRNDDPLGLNLQ